VAQTLRPLIVAREGSGPRETRQRLEYCTQCWILHTSATTHSTWGSASTYRLLLGQLSAPEVCSAEYYPQPRHGMLYI